MTLIEALLTCARCSGVEELKQKDKYVRRHLANQLVSKSITPDTFTLKEWNEAIDVFGGKNASNQTQAMSTLLELLSPGL